MTTRRFSAINLPNPRYSLEVGKFDLRQTQDLNLSTIGINDNTNCGGRHTLFCDNIHYIEVIEPGTIMLGHGKKHLSQLITTSVVIEDCRPELFLRRDFLSKFIDNGKIFLSTSQVNDFFDNLEPKYHLMSVNDNILIILMNEKQYRRFGMVAKKVIQKRNSKVKAYRVEIDLCDKRIQRSNKFQDKLINMLRRLEPVNKIYFRFCPDINNDDIDMTTIQNNCNHATVDVKLNTDNLGQKAGLAAAKEALEFFNRVIEEYAIDGFKPVPLSKCHLSSQKIQRSWSNYNQLHPNLNLVCDVDVIPDSGGSNEAIDKRDSANGSSFMEYDQQVPHKCLSKQTTSSKVLSGDGGKDSQGTSDKNVEHIVEIIDWLGYQLLSLDCDRGEICDSSSEYMENHDSRLDVICSHMSGTMDSEHIEKNLWKIFNTNSIDHTIFRALVLYYIPPASKTGLNSSVEGGFNQSMSSSSSFSNNRAGVVLVQDCANGSEAANMITVVAMSACEN